MSPLPHWRIITTPVEFECVTRNGHELEESITCGSREARVIHCRHCGAMWELQSDLTREQIDALSDIAHPGHDKGDYPQ